MQQQNVLSTDMLGRIRALALQQVEVMDELEAALQADDQPRVMELARRIVDLEKEVVKQ